MKPSHSLLAALILCAPVAALAAHPGAQPGTRTQAQQQSAPGGEPAQLPPPVASDGQFGEDSDYVIGPGDVIQVYVFREPELSITVPVRSDGKVTTPLIEDLVAVGLTPSALARAMEERLSKYIRSPKVNIIVTNPQNVFSKVTVIGQVGSQQSIPYQKGMKVLDVVLAVGGLGEFAAGNKAEILRKDAGGRDIKIPVKLNDLVKKGRIQENVDIKPGDILIVPESMF